MIYYYDRGGSRPVFTGKGAASIRATSCPMEPRIFRVNSTPVMAVHGVSGKRNKSVLKGILGNVLFSGGNKVNLERNGE